MCEIHPTRSWGSSHISQNETAPRILPLFFHFAVLSGRLGTCSCEALWWKPIRQILEEYSRGAVTPGCQKCSTVLYKYISHAGFELTLNYIIFLCWLQCRVIVLFHMGENGIRFLRKCFIRFINIVRHRVSANVELKLLESQI